MTELFNWLLGLLKQFKIFVVVMPWETVVRCRMGNRVAVWGPGWHVRIPFVDTLHVINTRLRIGIAPTQTLTTLDRQPLSVAFSVGFRIVDARAALMRFAEPEQSVSALAQSVVADVVSTRNLADLRCSDVEQAVTEKLRSVCEGSMEVEFVRVLDFVSAPTLRLLQEQWRQATSQTERQI